VLTGCRLLEGVRPLHHLLPGILHHHEWYDGTGYPQGLRGATIPLLARVLAVADSYDALRCPRATRPALAHAEVEEVFRQGAGRQWDPQVIQAYARCADKVRLICQPGLGDSPCPALGRLAQGEDQPVHGPGATGQPGEGISSSG
jgi:HD-GYP domain-containing protein (c-di-GMP phosphodiesterase class II)